MLSHGSRFYETRLSCISMKQKCRPNTLYARLRHHTLSSLFILQRLLLPEEIFVRGCHSLLHNNVLYVSGPGLFFVTSSFPDFGTVFLTAVISRKLRKAHCSPPLVDEDNSMVFTSHSVPFPATRDLWSLVAGNGTS